jgi:hypothetical protein
VEKKYRIKSKEEIESIDPDWKGFWGEVPDDYFGKEVILEDMEGDETVLYDNAYGGWNFKVEWLEEIKPFKGIDGAWDNDKTGISEFAKPIITAETTPKHLRGFKPTNFDYDNDNRRLTGGGGVEPVEEEIDFSVSSFSQERLDAERVVPEPTEELKDLMKSEYTTKHYDFTYKLTPEDIERGTIKIDPYFVGMEWGVGEKDPSGILSHNLKTIARFGVKNSKRREAEALAKQSENLLRFY